MKAGRPRSTLRFREAEPRLLEIIEQVKRDGGTVIDAIRIASPIIHEVRKDEILKATRLVTRAFDATPELARTIREVMYPVGAHHELKPRPSRPRKTSRKRDVTARSLGKRRRCGYGAGAYAPTDIRASRDD